MKKLLILLGLLLWLTGCNQGKAPDKAEAPSPAGEVYYQQQYEEMAAPAPTAPVRQDRAIPPGAMALAPSPSPSLESRLPLDKMTEEMRANIAFNVPAVMHYDETSPIQLELDPVRTLEEVKALVKEQGDVVGAEIDITPRMQASLKGEGFRIVPISPEIQAVLSNKPSEWRWDVTPTVKQNTTLSLYLTINMIMKVEGAETSRMVQSFRREIRVSVTPKGWFEIVLDAFGGDWKWLLGTIFIPLFLWWFNQRKPKPAAGESNDPPQS
jgi:outer membrane lipopolysaccharide assembly protein LptE/RlpB